MLPAPRRCRPAASSACSCLGCRPGGGTIFAHVHIARHGAAADRPFKGPANAISRHRHVALQLQLIAMDRTLQRAAVDLALVVAGHGIAVLLQDEMLLAHTAGVMDADRPGTA